MCSPQSAATIQVVIDERAQRVASLRVDGQIPTYPGKWVEGSVELEFRYDLETRIVAPDTVDSSGLECLARELDMTGADRASLRASIAQWTTEQLRELFIDRCDFDLWPPGTDFGTR